MGEGHFQGSAGWKPLKQLKPNLAQFITPARSRDIQKTKVIARKVSSPQYGEVARCHVCYSNFYLVIFFSPNAGTDFDV
jgi:hypothetical protein